jgi:hypothetical protein
MTMRLYALTLFPPVNRDYSTFALRPLLIAGLVTPVVEGDGGIGLETVENPAGVLTAVDPWLRMEVGDRIDVYWNDELVKSRLIESLDVDQRLFFYLPAEKIVPDWAEKVFYRLTRNGSTTPEDSAALRIRVKLNLPGGVDKDPHLPGHSELAAPVLPQVVIDNGVDAEWAARGVPAEIAAYPGRAAQDTIQLQWGDAFLSHRVTASEADGEDPIVITVDQATILAGGDDVGLLVHYQVFDEVWNFSTDWSLRTFVGVEAGAQRLDAPIIKEAVNGIIDLEQLSTDDVTVQIEVRGLPFERSDTLTMTWKGTTNSGDPLTYTDSVIIDNIPSVTEIKVPNAEIRAIIDGRGEASYVLTKANGDPPQSSKRAFASVTGKIPLPMPTVFEAVGDTLDPTLGRVHVVIPVYERMANGDLINMIWLGTRQNGDPYLHEAQHPVTNSEVGGEIYIPVTEEHISILANGTLDVSYRVSNDAPSPTDVRVSDHLQLVLAARYAELPSPSVDEAENDVLDPEKYPGSATYRVSYTGTAVGDILTWYWEGESPDGSASDWVPITSLSAGKELTFNIPRSLIEPNINNLVKLYYSLKLASTGKYQYSRILELTIGKLIGELPPPEVLEANGTTLDPMQVQSGATVRVRYDSMDTQDIITLVWIGTPGTGTPPNQELPGHASGQVDFPVPASVIGANIGERVSVAYQVKRYVTDKQSDILLLDISPIPDNQLPSPLITQANPQTKVLNLATFAGNAMTTVAKWPFIALGQRAWLRLEGENENGGPQEIVLLDGAEVTSTHLSSGLSETVLRSELEKLGQDTTLTVICKIAFSGVASESSALPLPSTVYTFKAHHDWVTPAIVNVKDSKGEVANGGTTFDTRLTLSGTGTIESELDIVDGTTSLATPHTDASGAWTAELPSVPPKTYSITAVAKDGSGLISQPRTFEVLANVTPIIEQALGSGGPVSNGGTTVDSSLTLSGKASPDQQIELFDGTTSKGKATTDGLGNWSLLVPGLTVARHSFTAKALYGTEPVSTAWVVNVAQNIVPTITSILDSAGVEVPANGSTVATSVTLTGNASAGLQVQIYDGAASKGTATANANGVWTLPLTGLSVASHAIKAKALYGNGAESAVRSFTVVASVAPIITSIKDSKNVEIPANASTVDTSVTLTGNASAGLQVQIFDGAASKGTATANASGVWTLPLTGLAVAAHDIKAKALYGSGAESAVRSFTVIASVTPSITSIKDTGGVEIPANGSTVATSVTLTGNASKGLDVEIFDGTTSKGTTTANANGVWTLSLTGLAVAAHAIKAKALYGSGAESAVRTFNVVASVAPVITSIKDSKNVEIPANASTVDTSVTLTGNASAGLQVQIYDGAVSKGTATANANGVWTLPLTGLAVAAHNIKAKALYGSGAESAVRSFTVIASVAPTITSIKDSSQNEVPPNGSTTDTSVTLAGNATAGQRVQIFDGSTSKGEATVNASGAWTLPLTGLSVASHAIKAKALYGNGAESPVRNFTVILLVAPSITRVVDPQNNPIANGGLTFAASVTASGQASNGQPVEIFDGTISKGTVTASATGAWSRVVSVPGTGSHSLTAKALYGSNPVSPAWSFTVKAATVPTLTSVRDSKGEVGNGGTTTDTSVTASGNAAASEQVEVFDGAKSKGTASVGTGGNWSHAVSGLELGSHSLKAVAKYGDRESSNVRTFTVKSPVPEFVLDPSQVTLGGRLYVPYGRLDIDPLSWPAGTTSTRTASGGVAPYTYQSSNAEVARVNSSGTIYARGNGTATITARDSAGNSKSYPVNVTGVTPTRYFGNANYPNARSTAASAGMRLPTWDEIYAMNAQYGDRWPWGHHFWTTTGVPGRLNYNYAIHVTTGGNYQFFTKSFFGGWSFSDVLGI